MHRDRSDRNKYQAAFDNACYVSRSLKNPKVRAISDLTAPALREKPCRITVCNESCIEPFFRLLDKGQHG